MTHSSNPVKNKIRPRVFHNQALSVHSNLTKSTRERKRDIFLSSFQSPNNLGYETKSGQHKKFVKLVFIILRLANLT